MGLTRTAGVGRRVFGFSPGRYSYILMENSGPAPYELGKGYLRGQSRTVNVSGQIFRPPALRIFGGQFRRWPNSPSLAACPLGTRRIILVDYCAITWVHTCSRVGCPRTSYLYAVEYTYVFVSHGFSMETLARGRACCDTLIPKSVAISPRYNK